MFHVPIVKLVSCNTKSRIQSNSQSLHARFEATPSFWEIMSLGIAFAVSVQTGDVEVVVAILKGEQFYKKTIDKNTLLYGLRRTPRHF